MQLFSRRRLAIAVAVFLTATSARADFIVTQDPNPNNLLTSLLGSSAGLSNFSATATGDPLAFGRFEGGTAAIGLPNGVVLSTGRASDVVGANLSGNTSSMLSASDNMTLRIGFDSDGSASKLFFRFVFGSEEFPEYAGSQFNDRFELRLNGTNLAKLSDGKDVTINNLAPTPSGPFHPDYINNAGGALTQLDAYTIPLTFEGSLLTGANVLDINIRDVGDNAYDSAVFIEGGTLGTKPPDNPGNVLPAPPAAVLAALGAFGLAWFRRRRVAKGADAVAV